MVLLREEDDSEPKVRDYFFDYESSPFAFYARREQRFWIVAFEDANEDLVYQSTEAAGVEKLGLITESVHNVHVKLGDGSRAVVDFPIDLSGTVKNVELVPRRRNNGAVVRLDDPRFSPENGAKGQREPRKFLEAGLLGSISSRNTTRKRPRFFSSMASVAHRAASRRRARTSTGHGTSLGFSITPPLFASIHFPAILAIW